jgi:hypothetical protein
MNRSERRFYIAKGDRHNGISVAGALANVEITPVNSFADPLPRGRILDVKLGDLVFRGAAGRAAFVKSSTLPTRLSKGIVQPRTKRLPCCCSVTSVGASSCMATFGRTGPFLPQAESATSRERLIVTRSATRKIEATGNVKKRQDLMLSLPSGPVGRGQVLFRPLSGLFRR